MKDCNKKKDFETMEKACEYFDAYADYFKKGEAWISEILPRLNKHRDQVQQVETNSLLSVQRPKLRSERLNRKDSKVWMKLASVNPKCLVRDSKILLLAKRL